MHVLIGSNMFAESLQGLTEKLQAAVHCEQLGKTRGISLIIDSLTVSTACIFLVLDPIPRSTEKCLFQELHSLHCAQRTNVWIDFLVDLLALGDHPKVSDMSCRSLCRALHPQMDISWMLGHCRAPSVLQC